MKDIQGVIQDIYEYMEYLKITGVKEIPVAEKEDMTGKYDRLYKLREKIGDCTRCKLWKNRTHLVFGTGNPYTDLLFIGEAPGEEEDLQGKPFVGRAGELLTKMIEAMGIKREDVYITNVVKCRPPGNRNPEKDEINTCRPFLEEQISIISPKLICTLGAVATKTILGGGKITEIRGKVQEYRGIKVVPTFHPAYLLRNPGHKRLAWKDLQVIMKELCLTKKE